MEYYFYCSVCCARRLPRSKLRPPRVCRVTVCPCMCVVERLPRLCERKYTVVTTCVTVPVGAGFAGGAAYLLLAHQVCFYFLGVLARPRGIRTFYADWARMISKV